MIRFECPGCGVKIRVEDTAGGATGKCPKCGVVVHIPTAGEPPEASRQSVPEPVVGTHAPAGAATPRRNREAVTKDGQVRLLDDSGREDADPESVLSDFEGYEKAAPATNAEPPKPPLLRRIPKAGWYVALFLILGLGLAAGSWFVLRDTWEVDHRQEILALEREAASLRAEKSYGASLDRYHRLLELVKGRKLESADLRKVVLATEKGIEAAKEGLKLQEADAFHEKHKTAFLQMMGTGDTDLRKKDFKAAITSYRRAADLMGTCENPLGATVVALKQAKDATEYATAEWKKSVSDHVSETAASAKLALDKGDIDVAEAQYAELIRFVQANREVSAVDESKVAATARHGMAAIALIKEKRVQELVAAELLAAERREEQERLEAEKRKEEERKQAIAAKLAPWRQTYEVVLQIHGDVLTAKAAPGSKLNPLETVLSAKFAALPKAGLSEDGNTARQSCQNLLQTLQAYRKALTETVDGSAGAVAQQARQKLARGKLEGAVAAFVLDYGEFAKSTGGEEEIVPKALKVLTAKEAERRAILSRCRYCKDTGLTACPDCKKAGRSTGKGKCPTCQGKLNTACPQCNGNWGRECGACKGTGKVLSRNLIDGMRRWLTCAVYNTNDTAVETTCNGTGWTHFSKATGEIAIGRCPTCGDKSKHLRGKMVCPECKGSGQSGTCPACGGKKVAPCPHCEHGNKLGADAGATPAAGSAKPKLPPGFKPGQRF